MSSDSLQSTNNFVKFIFENDEGNLLNTGWLTMMINTIQLDAVRRRADDILLQNLIADDDQHSGSRDIDHIEFSGLDVGEPDQDLELQHVVFAGPQDDH